MRIEEYSNKRGIFLFNDDVKQDQMRERDRKRENRELKPLGS